MQINKAQLLNPFPICEGLNRAPLRAGGRASRRRQTHQLPQRTQEAAGWPRPGSAAPALRHPCCPSLPGPGSVLRGACVLGHRFLWGERPVSRSQAGQRAAGSAPSRDSGLRWPRPRCPSIVDVPTARGQNNEQEAEPEPPYTSA